MTAILTTNNPAIGAEVVRLLTEYLQTRCPSAKVHAWPVRRRDGWWQAEGAATDPCPPPTS